MFSIPVLLRLYHTRFISSFRILRGAQIVKDSKIHSYPNVACQQLRTAQHHLVQAHLCNTHKPL